MRYFITLSLLLLVGCEAHYRYPCQDPENWDKDFCKAPRCEVNRDCPEYIFKKQPEVKVDRNTQPQPQGGCK